MYVIKEYVNPKFQKKFKIPIPIELILIIISLLISHFAKFKDNFGVTIVGEIPQGLPAPLVPDFAYMPNLLVEAIPLAVVGATISMSLVKTYSLHFGYKVDYNQEFIALGFSNFLGSFFQCFYACGALARCAVVVEAGMKTQLASIISCVGMLIVILFLGPLFESVPKCVLGAIIVISLKNNLKAVTELPTVWKISRIDFSVWVIAALSVIILDVTMGLVIGFAYTIFSMVLRTMKPPIAILGRIDDTEIYKNCSVYPAAKEIPGLKIIRFDCPINFANSDVFRDTVIDIVNNSSYEESMDDTTHVQSSLHTVILDGTSWAYIDAVGCKAAKECYKVLTKRGLRVLFAGVKDPARSRFLVTDFFKDIREKMFFISTHDAVVYSLEVSKEDDFAENQEYKMEFKKQMTSRSVSLLNRQKSRQQDSNCKRKSLIENDLQYFDTDETDNV